MRKFNVYETENKLSSMNKNSDSYGTEDSNESVLMYDIQSPSLQQCLEEFAELGEIQAVVDQAKKTHQEQFSPGSLRLLRAYDIGMNRLKSERIIEPTFDAVNVETSNDGFSTEKIMRIAGERFIQSFTETIDVVSMLDNPFNVSLSGLSDEDAKKVELAQLLLSAAEKVGHQLYNRARILLNHCDELSSFTGNAVERVVYYFSKALRERIDRETAKVTFQTGLGNQQFFNVDEAIMAPSPNILAIYQEIPFSQVSQYAGIQAVVENVTRAKKVHIIDPGIRIGVQWTGLMQALVEESGCPLELLKITAIGTSMKDLIEDTGKRLTSFAQSINLPFSFNIVMVSDILDLQPNHFDFDSDETLVIYCEHWLRTLLPVPDRLSYMMKLIKTLKPSIMVVTEPECHSTSPSFVTRFIEALFFHSAYFDCLESCMGNEQNRIEIECLHFGDGIRNILATEGEERKLQTAKLHVWRAYFARFGMVETELSTSSLCQGRLVARKFACGSACTLEQDGKSLLIGWKGTPIYSLSVWRFI
ncbi:DELLA protein RGL2-like [Euphorbia lathyris]|uniref:DELLA protein RGL2-like n=1 Tax=Euphorbia lathyris TaxID=212925 RepID=UPI003313B373